MDPTQCTEHAETVWALFQSPAHWIFELCLEAISAMLGVAVWPFVKKGWRNALKHWLHRHDACCAKDDHDRT
jgi:hypothetical protein